MGTHPIFESDFDCLTVMDLLGSIMGKMEKSAPPKAPEVTKQQKEAIERNKKIIENEKKRKKKFVEEIELQNENIIKSENPDLIEKMPKLLKVNFKPMDDIWRSTVHELAQDYGLESISLGKGEERHVCVCSRPPTHIEMAELRGEPLKTEEKTEKDSLTKKTTQNRT